MHEDEQRCMNLALRYETNKGSTSSKTVLYGAPKVQQALVHPIKIVAFF